ncbi:MAG: hypothetical protein HW400_725 [Candidatus Levybacteria bacterium]|nr:hypothetical protein [Candidatus Levybacteria bacterium]
MSAIEKGLRLVRRTIGAGFRSPPEKLELDAVLQDYQETIVSTALQLIALQSPNNISTRNFKVEQDFANEANSSLENLIRPDSEISVKQIIGDNIANTWDFTGAFQDEKDPTQNRQEWEHKNLTRKNGTILYFNGFCRGNKIRVRDGSMGKRDGSPLWTSLRKMLGNRWYILISEKREGKPDSSLLHLVPVDGFREIKLIRQPAQP